MPFKLGTIHLCRLLFTIWTQYKSNSFYALEECLIILHLHFDVQWWSEYQTSPNFEWSKAPKPDNQRCLDSGFGLPFQLETQRSGLRMIAQNLTQQINCPVIKSFQILNVRYSDPYCNFVLQFFDIKIITYEIKRRLQNEH